MMPKNSAIIQHVRPATALPFVSLSLEDSAMAETITPSPAKGIFNQFNAPRHGIKPTSMPIIANIPQIDLKFAFESPFNF